MNEIKLYMKFLYQYSYKVFLILIGVFSMFPIVFAGMMYTINLFIEDVEEIGEMHFEVDKFIIGAMFVIGIGAIVKCFEVVMRIRADRKSFMRALGMMAMIGAVSIGVW